MSSDHLPPRVCTIQEQLATLVTILSLYVFPTGDASQPGMTLHVIAPLGEQQLITGVPSKGLICTLYGRGHQPC